MTLSPHTSPLIFGVEEDSLRMPTLSGLASAPLAIRAWTILRYPFSATKYRGMKLELSFVKV